MEDTFKFDLGIGRYPWASADVIIEVTIPGELHQCVAERIGTGKMARLEFGFRFQQIVEELFPELNAMIRMAIAEWAAENAANTTPGAGSECSQFYYSLQSPWFEE